MLSSLMPILPLHFCVDQSRTDSVDANTARGQLNGQGSDHGAGCGFTCSIDRCSGLADLIVDRGVDNDRGMLAEQRESGLDGVENSFNVDVHNLIEKLLRDSFDRQ